MSFELQSELAPAMRRAAARPNGHDRKQPSVTFVEENPPLPAPAGEIRSYDDLHRVLRERANALEISRENLDHVSGLTSGMSAKLLSLSRIRRLGVMSLGVMLDALSLKLIAVPDDAAFARNRTRYIRRDRAHHLAATRGHATKPRPPKLKPLKKITGTITGRMFGWPPDQG